MKVGRVIGRVVLSRSVDSLRGGCLFIVNPFAHSQYAQGSEPSLSSEPSLVVYDNLGAGVGQTVAYEEGREAAQPFDPPIPIDAVDVALVDRVFYFPYK